MADVASNAVNLGDSFDSYNLHWLFDPDRIDHLPIEEQLKRYKSRDLRWSKLFRFGLGLWEAPPLRKRRIIAPPMNVEAKSTVTSAEYSTLLKPQSPILPGSPGQLLLDKTSGEDREQELSAYRKWLEERRDLRKSLDSLGLSDEWLARKPDKTDLERRVLRRILEEKYPRMPIAPPAEEPPVEGQLPEVLPTVQRPSPTAIRVIEKFLYERHIRLIDLFEEVDKNKDWMVSREDFRLAIKMSGMPLSDGDIDDLLVVFDENDTGQLDYRHLALSLKLWKREKKEAKKLRQLQASSATSKVVAHSEPSN